MKRGWICLSIGIRREIYKHSQIFNGIFFVYYSDTNRIDAALRRIQNPVNYESIRVVGKGAAGNFHSSVDIRPLFARPNR